jgi:hypothetical protein
MRFLFDLQEIQVEREPAEESGRQVAQGEDSEDDEDERLPN